MIGNYYLRSDPRGSTIASTGVSDPNKYRQGEVGGLYSYGAAGAQGRIELESLYIDKRYMNNFAATDTLDFRSYKYGGTFYWRIGPKTEWLFQGTDIKTDYVSPASPLDNTEHRLLTGLKWEATAWKPRVFSLSPQIVDALQVHVAGRNPNEALFLSAEGKRSSRQFRQAHFEADPQGPRTQGRVSCFTPRKRDDFGWAKRTI